MLLYFLFDLEKILTHHARFLIQEKNLIKKNLIKKSLIKCYKFKLNQLKVKTRPEKSLLGGSNDNWQLIKN